MQVRRAPRFIAVKSSNTNLDRGTIEVLYEGEDGQHYAIELDPTVIAASIMAMSSHLNELAATDPNLPSQGLTVQGTDLVMSPSGEVALQLQLDGALKISLRFPPEQAAPLATMLADLQGLISRKVQ